MPKRQPPTPTAAERRFYRPAEVATMFGAQDDTITRWCADGVLPPLIRMGRLRFIHRDAIDRLTNQPGDAA